MRVFRTDLGFYNSLQEARAAIRRAADSDLIRAIARREVLRPPPTNHRQMARRQVSGSRLPYCTRIMEPNSESERYYSRKTVW
jgi:hypothetical protein